MHQPAYIRCSILFLLEPLGVVMFLFPLSYFISPFNISKILPTRERRHEKKERHDDILCF